MSFWIAFTVDATVAAVCLWFFILGLADGSVSAVNLGLWLGILAVLALILGGGWWLHHQGHAVWALRLLLVLAIPAALAGVFLLIVLISKPRWN